MTEPKERTDAQWRQLLTPFEFHVLREAGTERAGTGALLREDRRGVFHCRACGAALFRAEAKFDSGCGWPSFFEAFPQATKRLADDSHGLQRVEVRCANCESHLGHVFPDAPQTPTGERYCMNSVALSFEPDEPGTVA